MQALPSLVDPILWLSVLRSSSRLAVFPHVQSVKVNLLPSHRARNPPCQARSFFASASSVTELLVFTVTELNSVFPLARPIAPATNAGYLISFSLLILVLPFFYSFISTYNLILILFSFLNYCFTRTNHSLHFVVVRYVLATSAFRLASAYAKLN